MTDPRHKSGSDQVPVADLSYTEASRELDGIVSFFEQREVDVDQLVSRLERATAIVDELDRRIRQTRMQVEELVPRLEAVAHNRPVAQETTPAPGPRAGDSEDEEEEDEDELQDVEDQDLEEEALETWDDDGGGDHTDEEDAGQVLF